MLTGSFLKKERLKAGFNKTEAAKAIGVSYYTLDNWERSKMTPKSSRLRKLQLIYGFEMDLYLECYRQKLMRELEKKFNLLKRGVG